MAKNILLLFLSTVKLNTKDGTISKAKYVNIDGEETENTNESAVRYLLQNGIEPDKIFILASKKVREEQISATDSRLHLDFFLERVKKFLPNNDCSVFSIFPYDENTSGAESLKSVADMAGCIQNYAKQFADEKIILHVDLTGGMRDTNIIMLDLTRLLEYSGLEIGRLLYSNYDYATKNGKVVELKNIYDLFQLIAGVEEFVNFGSANALNKYYEGKTLSEPLKGLLDAIKNFAAEIKLCHYGQFRDAIINLHDTVRDFAFTTPDNAEDILMQRLIGRIRADYHNLIIERELDDFKIIRWCLDHDYLQQALTLYTERIPEYIGEKKIITQSADEEKILAELVGKDIMKRNRWFYLFSDFEPRVDILNDGKKIYSAAVKIAAQKVIKDKAIDFDTWLNELNQKLKPLNLQCEGATGFRSQIEILAEIFKNPALLLDLNSAELNPIRKIVVALSANFETKAKGFERRKILAYFLTNKLSDDDVPKYFVSGSFIEYMKKYPKAVKMYELLVEKIFSVSIPQENFLSIVDKYFRIKNERNHSNHARADDGEFKTADELRKFMSDALDEIAANLPAQ